LGSIEIFKNNIEEKMEKIPFGVSSRAAILIGRENIANTKGAIIELVKNCYDADSPFCLVFIDNQYSTVQTELTIEDSNLLIKKGISERFIEQLYIEENNIFKLKKITEPKEKNSLEMKEYKIYLNNLNLYQAELRKLASLYIIDAGEGMTKKIIKDKWMVIGTDNKVHNFKSAKNRIKSGAKGIGRFALDKLGSNCTMLSVPSSQVHNNSNSISWIVNWKDFEESGKNINEINAIIEEIPLKNLSDVISKFLPEFDIELYLEKLKEIEFEKFSQKLLNFEELKFQNIKQILKNGTCFKIHNLYDNWDDKNVEQLFNDLEILVPPREVEDFSIFLFSSLKPNKYGEVLTSISDDFDYKLVAKVDSNQNVNLTIYREEFDTEIIPDDFFDLKEIQDSEFANKNAFMKKVFTKNFHLSNFLPGLENSEQLSKIGSFDFIFYFMKKAPPSNEVERYFYKNIKTNLRKEWLDKFGGIKIYRDNFRVRPYGEVKDPAFDWLGLGPRKTSSPAAASRHGGYKVQADQVSGIINISRLSNFEFNDKSSREGLQETETLRIFRNIILNIIAKFEDDRSFIMSQFKHYDDIKFGPARDLEKAKKLAESILKKEKEKRKNTNTNSQTNSSTEEHTAENFERIQQENITLAHLAKTKQEEVDKLAYEQKLLRGLASSGILSASLGHDLSKIKNNIDERHNTLVQMLNEKISPDEFRDTPSFMNPYLYIDKIKKDDKKIVEWLGFALGFTRKDKRKRKILVLNQYFKQLQRNWTTTLQERSISLEIECADDLNLRAFEIDFDSIFINLLSNSIDAFSLPIKRESKTRNIAIQCKDEDDFIIINYIDNGPGLSKDITNPQDIFKPMFTTKKEQSSGDDTGTGLGMWIIKSSIDEYDGKIQILNLLNSGFGVRIQIPKKYLHSTG